MAYPDSYYVTSYLRECTRNRGHPHSVLDAVCKEIDSTVKAVYGSKACL